MKGKLITIFGGAGFVGRTLVEKLASDGALLRVVVTNPDAATYLKVMGDPGQIKLFSVDFFDARQVESMCKDAWAVVNLIGTLQEKRKKTFDFAHIAVAEAIARACKAKSVDRFVHISAIGADLASHSDYLSTKGLGEQQARQIFPNVTIVRPSIIFGPNDRFFNLLARTLVLNPIFPFFGNAQTRLQPIYVGDVTDAIIKILKDSATNAQIFELGGPKVYTFKTLIEMILATIKRKRICVSFPYLVGRFVGTMLQILPNPPLTAEQVKLLKYDNVVSPEAKSLKDLGITPTPVESIVPSYLDRCRPTF